MELDQPFAVAPHPGSSGVVVARDVRLAACDFTGATIGNHGRICCEHSGLMVAELEADDDAGVQIRHQLIASLDCLFDLEVVRQQERLKRTQIVRLQHPPHPDLLNEDKVRFGVDVFGGCHLLSADRHDARRKQSEDED